MKTAFLDVNVLLALAWPNHQHHKSAHEWFVEESEFGWATCAITQTSFVRLSSNPAFTTSAVTPAQAAELLSGWTANEYHEFWESVSADAVDIFKNALNHQQVMDAWLVHEAEKQGGRFITFDRSVVSHAGSKDGLVQVLI